MTISKTAIEKKIARKRNPKLREAIIKLKKQGKLDIASILALPKRKRIVVNINKIDKESKDGDKVIVPGKVLGSGEMSHKISIAAFSFSETAKSKLKECNIVGIESMSKEKDAKIIK